VQFHATALAGLTVIEVTAAADERGLFARTFDAATFADAGMPIHWPQCNTSWNRQRGTLRGMHFEADLPSERSTESKLVRCTHGRAFDVAIDLRPQSPTYCRWVGIELSAENRKALYIPPGLAHGFLTLEDDTEIYYQMGANYTAARARGVRWNDPAFAITWPSTPRILSERDVAYPDFAR
jgi:dTDP-4-dehydrorhamnose 3,5-epimerase